MADNSQTPMSRLPRKAGSAAPSVSTSPQPAVDANPPKQPASDLQSFLKKQDKPAPKDVTPKEAQPKDAAPTAGSKIGPIFWTVASVISLTVNVILLLIIVFIFYNLQKAHLADVTKLGPNLLGGLYSNFEKMDNAHITKTIPVDTTIPVKFDLQLNQETNVVLSQNVLINNALVTVNTGGMNITRAAASIVLPKGTSLPVFLNLTVPVDQTVPVKIDVAVDIPLNETQLHEPFVGLSDVVAPLYCLFKPDATNGKGEMICK